MDTELQAHLAFCIPTKECIFPHVPHFSCHSGADEILVVELADEIVMPPIENVVVVAGKIHEAVPDTISVPVTSV